MNKISTGILLSLLLAGCGKDVVHDTPQDNAMTTSDSGSKDGNRGGVTGVDDHGVVTTSNSDNSEQPNFFEEDETELEADGVDPFCRDTYGCGKHETCLTGVCEPSCFKHASCDVGETCRWEDGEAVCIEPWSCSLRGGSGGSDSVGSCKIRYSCEAPESVEYVFECTGSDGKCYCIQNDKIVGEIQRPAGSGTYLMCSMSPEAISTINTECGWAILPRR